MQTEQLISARWVIPIEEDGEVLEHHAVAIDQGRITAILPAAEKDQVEAVQRIELPQHALLPGFVNAHTHAPMSLFRGLSDDLPLMAWLNEHIWPAEGRFVDESFVADGSRLAIAEMLRSGTTCFNDMYFFPDVTAEIAASCGMRASIGMILIDFPSAYAQDAAGYMEKATAFFDRYKKHELIRPAFAPHAPYSVSDQPLVSVRTLAHELDTQIHMHVHETVDELMHSQQHYGKRPINRLAELGLLGPNLLAVHMTQLCAEEIGLVAESGTHVVHCPESNMKLASGSCPVAQLLSAGVNVALGTDGAASNNDLDMIGELRSAALLAKLTSGDARAVPAWQALRMATLNGAKALGMDDRIGSIKPGKLADLTAIDLGTLECQPLYNPLSQIVYAASRTQVSDVWVAGQRLLAERKLTRLDESAIQRQAQLWQSRIGAMP